MFYNWHRFYIPELGRYNRVDPLGLYDGTNPFNYVSANPLSYVDPEGLAAKGAAIGGAIGGALGGLGGGLAGGIGGGAACTLVAPGVGTVGCGASGAASGAVTGGAWGAGIGAAIGSAIEDVCFSKGHEEYCQDQFDKDIQWCDQNTRGRKNIACHQWADDQLSLCLRNKPNFPFPLK